MSARQPEKRRWRQVLEGEAIPNGISWKLWNGVIVNLTLWALGLRFWVQWYPGCERRRVEIQQGMNRLGAKGGWHLRRAACWLQNRHRWAGWVDDAACLAKLGTMTRTCNRCGKSEVWARWNG